MEHWHNLRVLDFADSIFFDEAIIFRSWLCFHLQEIKAPNLVDSLHRSILSHWASSVWSTCVNKM